MIRKLVFCLSMFASIGHSAESRFKVMENWLPNSLSYQGGISSAEIDLKKASKLKVQTKSLASERGEVSQIASRLTLKKVDFTSKSLFDFKFSPTGSFAYYPFSIASDEVFFPDTDFQFLRTAIGYGPEIRIHLEFMTLIFAVSPGLQYSWVSWSSPISGGTFSRFDTNLMGSVQILKSVSKNFFIQAFYEYVYEDSHTWQKALTKSQGFEVPVKSVSSALSGLAIGYYWN